MLVTIYKPFHARLPVLIKDRTFHAETQVFRGITLTDSVNGNVFAL